VPKWSAREHQLIPRGSGHTFGFRREPVLYFKIQWVNFRFGSGSGAPPQVIGRAPLAPLL